MVDKAKPDVSWVAELFDRCSEIVALGGLSDGEKIGYLLAVSQEEPCVPSHLPLMDKVELIRFHYAAHFTETGC